ncbi:MAG: hypothetical protein KTR25_13410 [Myxococcales bacterium]|nr:hypothetical protein [Myxococcales bacterium]
MSKSHQKVLAKLRRLQLLAEGAGTEGERVAAEAARKRLVERLEKEGVHVAPELVQEVGAVSSEEELSEDIILEIPNASTDPVLHTVVIKVPEEIRSPKSSADTARHAPTPPISTDDEPGQQGIGSGTPSSLASALGSRTPSFSGFKEDQMTVVASRRGPSRVGPLSRPSTEKSSPAWREIPQEMIAAHEAPAPSLAPQQSSVPTTEILVNAPSMTHQVAAERQRHIPRPYPERGSTLRLPTRKVWYRHRFFVRLASFMGVLILAWAYFAPVDMGPTLHRPGLGAQSTNVNAFIRQCLFGVNSACSSLGTNIVDQARGAKWAPWEERSACAEGSMGTCAQLGLRFSRENQKRIGSPDMRSVATSADHFTELACAMGASSCVAP